MRFIHEVYTIGRKLMKRASMRGLSRYSDIASAAVFTCVCMCVCVCVCTVRICTRKSKVSSIYHSFCKHNNSSLFTSLLLIRNLARLSTHPRIIVRFRRMISLRITPIVSIINPHLIVLYPLGQPRQQICFNFALHFIETTEQSDRYSRDRPNGTAQIALSNLAKERERERETRLVGERR